MRALAAMIILATATAHADQEGPPRGVLEGRILTSETLHPIEGATIVVTDAEGGPVVITGSSDKNGGFRYVVPPGTYNLLAVFADARWLRNGVAVKVKESTKVAGVLAFEAEEITIHEAPPAPSQPAKVVRSTSPKVPPYSDEAIDGNTWAVGWVLLDIDEAGVVTGFRYLHRPGHALDAIAEKVVWGLRFEPARDDDGKPMRTKLLWKLEWPAFHWAKQHQLFDLGGQGGLKSALQEDRDTWTGANDPYNRGTFVLPGEHKPPCRGHEGLNLDLHEPIYRDCSPPDLGKINTEPLITRPAR